MAPEQPGTSGFPKPLVMCENASTGLTADEMSRTGVTTAICRKKGPPQKTRASLQQYVVGSPMERIALNVLGPLTLTEQGNKYILVVADYFSKWTEAFPMPDQESSTVADFLVKEVISQFGVPLLNHSDQGKNFESALFSEICHMLGMKKTRTTPYLPQSDGMVERFNRTLLDQLAKFADYHQTDWDEHIPFLMMAYRLAVHEATNCSPAKVLFGRDLQLPIDLLLGRPEEECPESVKQYTRDLCQRLEKIHCFTRKHLKLSSDRMKKRYDLLQEGQPLGSW